MASASAKPIATAPPLDDTSNTDSAGFNSLPVEILERVAGSLPDNDVADGLRLTCRAAARALVAPRFRRLHLSKPVLHWGDAVTPGAARSLSLSKRRELLRLVAGSGVLANLQAALAAADCRPPADLLKDGSASSAEVCSWVDANLQQCSALATMKAAAAGGCLSLLQAAAAEAVAGRRSALCAEQLACAAARHGQQHVLEWVLEAVHTSSEQKSAAGKEEGKGKASAGTGTGLTFIMRMWHLHTLAGTALRYGHLRLAAWILEVYGRRLLQHDQRWRDSYRNGEEVVEPPPLEEEHDQEDTAAATGTHAGAAGASTSSTPPLQEPHGFPPPPRLAHAPQLARAESGLGPSLMISASAGAPLAWMLALHAAFFPRSNHDGCCNAYTSSWIRISIETAAGSQHPEWREKVDWLMSLDGGPNFPSAAFDSVCIVAASVPGPPGAGAERVCWLLRRGAHIPLSLRPHAVHGAAKLGDLTSFAALLEMQREQGPDKGDGGTQQWGRGRLYDNNVAERLLVLSALGFTPGLKLVVEQMGLAAAAAVPSPTDGGGRRGGGGDGEDGGVELVTRPQPWAWVPEAAKRAALAGHLTTLAYLTELVQLQPPIAAAAVATVAEAAAPAAEAAAEAGAGAGTAVPGVNTGTEGAVSAGAVAIQPEAATAATAAAVAATTADGPGTAAAVAAAAAACSHQLAAANSAEGEAARERLAELLSPRLMAAAAFGGATDVMRWLHERGCEADARSWLLAARGGCCEAMELLAEWRCPRPRHSGQRHEVVAQAVAQGDLMGLRCLQRLGWDVAAGLKPLPKHARRALAGSCHVDVDADPNEHFPELRQWLKAQRWGGLRALIGLGGGVRGGGGGGGGAGKEPTTGQTSAGGFGGSDSRGGFWRGLKRLLHKK
eukprot:XP_001700986.1 predicted protein [Chlamydomonas reinhardtii]